MRGRPERWEQPADAGSGGGYGDESDGQLGGHAKRRCANGGCLSRWPFAYNAHPQRDASLTCSLVRARRRYSPKAPLVHDLFTFTLAGRARERFLHPFIERRSGPLAHRRADHPHRRRTRRRSQPRWASLESSRQSPSGCPRAGQCASIRSWRFVKPEWIAIGVEEAFCFLPFDPLGERSRCRLSHCANASYRSRELLLSRSGRDFDVTRSDELRPRAASSVIHNA
jgi:hypothetical protein